MIRVLIVNDLCIVREGLRMFLGRDPEIEIVDEATDGVEAFDKTRRLRPDVVVMDLLLPGISGLEAISIIRREMPETKVVAISIEPGIISVMKIIRAGANGYLLKDTEALEMRGAIKAVARGEIYLSPQAAALLMEEVRLSAATELLTTREMDVLHSLAQGCSNREIAGILYLSENTVKTHVRHILEKLGVQSRTQAIVAAMQLGLVAPTANSISGLAM
ncbi:MAG: response regulator transcription factor [Ktedonobacteraceae bacterium]|nr:response regulator transcription factor [Ktedonobacteraceae bacterium]MBV9615119.1 response regulator transcription factor [Ktedonobacteraceae bacterium]MBV9713003.1 response regulator transcription factor [Ktedonobacteraceae bacterium]